MQMTLTEVLNKQNTLRELLRELAGKKLPYKLTYTISKNLVKLQSEAKIIEDGRMKLIDSYAVKDEDGKPVIKDNSYDLGEKVEEFTAEFQKYMATETEVDIYSVPAAVFEIEDPRFDVLTVEQIVALIVALDFMIEE